MRAPSLPLSSLPVCCMNSQSSSGPHVFMSYKCCRRAAESNMLTRIPQVNSITTSVITQRSIVRLIMSLLCDCHPYTCSLCDVYISTSTKVDSVFCDCNYDEQIMLYIPALNLLLKQSQLKLSMMKYCFCYCDIHAGASLPKILE